MSTAQLAASGIKDQIDLPFRTIRLGSLRSFPVKREDSDTKHDEGGGEFDVYQPLHISEKGLKFSLTLNQDSDESVTIKISSKRIQRIHAFTGRGCPVLWIRPDKMCAERIRNLCNMNNSRGPYLDPDSVAEQEHEIAVICAQDPLPFAVGHSIQQIFQRVAKKRNIKSDKFFKLIPHKENNDKLVRCTVYMDNMDHNRGGGSSAGVSKSPKPKPAPLRRRNVSESSDDYSDYDVDESGILTDDANDSDFRVKANPKGFLSSIPRNLPARNATKKLSDDRISSSKQVELSDNRDLDKANKNQSEGQGREAALAAIRERKDLDTEATRQLDTSPDKSKNQASSSVNTSPGSDPPRKVHRARKSIPNRHRAVSIESQLRARIVEQLPKDSVGKRNAASSVITATKRKHSDESDGSDQSGRPSESELPTLENKKKNKPKDPILLSAKKKKKKTDNSSESSCSTPDVFETSAPAIPRSNGQPNNDLSLVRPTKPDRKAQTINLHMRTLRQDANSLLHLTPLCTCVVKSPHKLKLSTSEVNKCMAMEYIDGRLNGCNEDIVQPEMFRPSNKIPVLGLCNNHRERMIRHESCPGCGAFCVGGTFLACIKNPECPHRFHRDCMILSGRHGDCPHCGGDLSDVKEVRLTPGRDEDLMWILAAHNPEKVRSKQYVAERGRSARMGHRPTIMIVPEKIPGISKTLPSGVVIDLTTLAPGSERKKLEELLCNLQREMSKKHRFQPKFFLQYVSENDIAKVLQMLSDGFDLAIHKSTLDTAVRETIPDGDLALVHVLIQAGASVNTRYENGDTPLFRAMQKKKKMLIFYLLVNKADINIMDEDGMTVLHRAAMDGYVDGVHLLLFYGKANVNSRSEGGYTPIMWAAEHKQSTMAQYLVHYGADVSAIDNEGNLCLHWAALSGNVDILQLCLQRSSDPNHCNTHGDTPLHVAARENNQQCIYLLLAHGANPMIKNKETDTPLDCSSEQNTAWMTMKVNQWIRKAGIMNHKNLNLPLNKERVLSTDMSRGYDNVPIMCVNAVDDAACPTDPPSGFHYVTENVHTSTDTKINHTIGAMQYCSCTDGCKTANCNCGIISEGCWYAENGTLLPNFDIREPPLVFECHKMCKCSKSCRNRVVQNGIKYRLQVYRTVGMGWGLRALESIPRGAYVCDYVGELISDAEADNREDDSYLFDLENKDGDMFCLDARNYGNVSRFINHLCEPNLVPIRVFVDHHDLRFPKLSYFTTRDIKPYEELGFDYGDRFWDVKCRQFTCQCKSPKCKYSAEAYRIKAEKEAENRMKEDSVQPDSTINEGE